jgi:hypothetical protein
VAACAALYSAAHPRRWHPLDTRGAEFEFRDFAHRVERRIRQQVGGGFRIAEWHEHHADRHVAVRADLHLDDASPGFQADHVAGLQAHPVELTAAP